MKNILIITIPILLFTSLLYGQTKKTGVLYLWKNGTKYMGEWKDGKKHGQGTFTYGKGKWEGEKYVGEFKDGYRNGQGTYTWSNGRKYEGEFKNGLFWNTKRIDCKSQPLALASYLLQIVTLKGLTVNTINS